MVQEEVEEEEHNGQRAARRRGRRRDNDAVDAMSVQAWYEEEQRQRVRQTQRQCPSESLALRRARNERNERPRIDEDAVVDVFVDGPKVPRAVEFC